MVGRTESRRRGVVMRVQVLFSVAIFMVYFAVCGNGECSQESVQARTQMEGLWMCALTNRSARACLDEDHEAFQCVRTNLLAVTNVAERNSLSAWVENRTLEQMVLRDDGMSEVAYYRLSSVILDALAGVLWETGGDEERVFALWDHQAKRCAEEAERCRREMGVLTEERKRRELEQIVLIFRLAIVPRNRLTEFERKAMENSREYGENLQQRLYCLECLKDAYARWDVGQGGRGLANGDVFRRYQSRRSGGHLRLPRVSRLHEGVSAAIFLKHIDLLVRSAPRSRIAECPRYPFVDYTNHVDRILGQYREIEWMFCSVPRSDWPTLLRETEARLAPLTHEYDSAFQEFNCLVCSYEVSNALVKGWRKLTGDDVVVRAFLQRRKECYVQALERCQRKLDGIEKMSKLVGDEIEQIKMRQHQISNGNPANDDWTQLDQLSQRQCDLWRKRWMLSNLIKAYRHYSARGGPDDGLVTISLGR